MNAEQAVRRVAVRTGFWLAGSGVGAAVVALPDSDRRVLSLSQTHGPSAVDVVGIFVLIVAWLPVATLLWRSSSSLRSAGGALAGVMAMSGFALLTLTIGLDTGAEWLLAVALLVAAQLLALGLTWRAARAAS